MDLWEFYFLLVYLSFCWDVSNVELIRGSAEQLEKNHNTGKGNSKDNRLKDSILIEHSKQNITCVIPPPT